MPRTHYSQSNLPPAQPEINSGEYILELDGFIPLRLQLLQLQAAGQRLKEFRAEAFDFATGEVDDNFHDPTRNPGFDMADASLILSEIEERFVKRRAEAEVAKNLQEAPQGDETPTETPPETPPEE